MTPKTFRFDYNTNTPKKVAWIYCFYVFFCISKGNRNITVCHIQIHHSSRKSSQFTHGTGKCCTGLWFGPGKPRAKSFFFGGIMLYLFWDNVPLSFFFFRWWVGYYFFPRKHGGVHNVWNFFRDRLVQLLSSSMYVCVVVVVVYNIFLALCPPCGASGAF